MFNLRCVLLLILKHSSSSVLSSTNSFAYLLFNVFELLDVLYFDVVWVVCQQVDGVGHHILRQQ